MPTKIKRTKVKSSSIVSLGYCPDSKTLEVEFYPNKNKIKPIWQYTPVEPSQFEALKNASSIGSYFAAEIRKNPSINPKKIQG